MAEIEDGSACVKKYFEPELENPSCQSGFVMDVINAPKCRKECASGYFSHFDFCYGVCPTELKQCGALCVEEDFICTDEQLEMSTKNLGDIDSHTKQTELVMQKSAPVCSIVNQSKAD